jgi:hypothetical protein
MRAVTDIREIKGWGADIDPDNRPAYPMKRPAGNDNQSMDWQRPAQQPVQVKIFHSIERPGITAVFGTSTPPRGLSGLIRRFAYRYSESSYAHWMPLILADRVNMIEGIFGDLLHGRIPNIFSEMGLRSEFRHNPKGLAVRVGVGVLVAYGLYAFFTRRR